MLKEVLPLETDVSSSGIRALLKSGMEEAPLIAAAETASVGLHGIGAFYANEPNRQELIIGSSPNMINLLIGGRRQKAADAPLKFVR